ncbi:hypothetical protein HDU76_009333 [Blyttiomyces sp. JEL0837]|nr:hypothetical protein HDU76_009333 [Blyttiomyces sp. JEL0837]
MSFAPPQCAPEPCSATSAKAMSGSGQKGNVLEFGNGGSSVKVTREIRQPPSDGPIFKIEDFNADVSIAIGSAIPAEADAANTSEFKKLSFLSQYPQEDTQKDDRVPRYSRLIAPATETLSAVPTDDQPLMDESIPPVKPVEEDTTNLQTETQDFEDAEKTAEDVAIVQASIGALEAMVDVEKVELNLASVATEIENVTKEVKVTNFGSIKQEDLMDNVITRISKLEKTLLDLIKKVDMAKRVVGDKHDKCGSCKKPKRYEHGWKAGFGKLLDQIKIGIAKFKSNQFYLRQLSYPKQEETPSPSSPSYDHVD